MGRRVAVGAAVVGGLGGLGALLSDSSDGAGLAGASLPLGDDVAPDLLPILGIGAGGIGAGGIGAGGVGVGAASGGIEDLLEQIGARAEGLIDAREGRYQEIIDADYGQRFRDESAARATATSERVQAIRDLVGAPDGSTHGGRVANLVRAADNAQGQAVVNRAGIGEAGMVGDRFWADELSRSSGATLQAAMLLANQKDRETAEARRSEIETGLLFGDLEHQRALELQNNAARLRPAATSQLPRIVQDQNFANGMANWAAPQWTGTMNEVRAAAVSAGVSPGLVSRWIDGEFSNVPAELGLFSPQESAAGANEVLGRFNEQIAELEAIPVRSQEQTDMLKEMLALQPHVQQLVNANYRISQEAPVHGITAAGIG